MDDLRVNNELLIPAAELKWRFDPSGGPGGQHANKSATRVELSWNIQLSAALDERSRGRIRGGVEMDDDGVVSVQVGESRSQWRNRQIARRHRADVPPSQRTPPRNAGSPASEPGPKQSGCGRGPGISTRSIPQGPYHSGNAL